MLVLLVRRARRALLGLLARRVRLELMARRVLRVRQVLLVQQGRQDRRALHLLSLALPGRRVPLPR